MRADLHNLRLPSKILVLVGLYFSQGIPFGLFSQALPVLLREQQASLSAIGFSSLLALPWGLKFLWSPWVDRALPGLPRRKGWLVPLQLVTMAVLAVLSQANIEASLVPFLVGILVVNALNATQDIATDGLAVEILAVDERGLGNSLQVGGYRVGMIFGGGGALWMIDRLGWSTGLLACVAALAAGLLPLLLTRETRHAPPVAEGADRDGRGFETLLSYATTPGAGTIVVLLVAFKFGDAFAAGMLRPLLVDGGLTKADIAVIVGGAGFTGGLLGALLGGAVASVMHRRRAILLGVIAQTGGVLLYLVLALQPVTYELTTWMVGTEHFVGGVATVVLFTCMMDWCREAHTGADYTILASVVVISTGVAAALSGVSAELLGYPGHFALSAVLSLVGGVWAWTLYPRAAKRLP